MPKLLYAHVHIPKTAGTTLIHLLRRNFFPRCMDVRPFAPSSNGVFRAKDLRLSLRINPMLQCITGHSVRATSDLETVVPTIRYFTILRDPVKRFISAYLYLNDVMKQNLSFEQHLRSEEKRNLQTRWIAGEPDLDAAKTILSKCFFLVGRTERLNEFILLLSHQLQAHKFDPCYRSQNLAVNRGRSTHDQALKLEDQYADDIREKNRVDVELVEYLDNVLMPRQQAQYGRSFCNDLTAFENAIATSRPSMLFPYLDFAMRKLYYDPVIGAVRLKNGMQYRGSF